MAEYLSKKPAKSILKTSTSFEHPESQKHRRHKSQDIQWDEMNILQTLHPPDKDYGHMKVDEPKTPFNYYTDEDVGDKPGGERGALDTELLTKKINLESENLPKAMIEADDDDDDDEHGEETEEERANRKAFEYRRKIHYNEFYAVKLARKLMAQEGLESEDEDNREETMDESQSEATKASGGSSDEEVAEPTCNESTEISL
ncbi:protein phosphatase inhibitor 2-like isoform X1 [Tachypleus tridentatus]|uniref:protein phosphatase inhibitor 2-like isoform X1 n=1 Tax=Tachypleus tridentatus TaxID=6853 RepID=UPI003FD60A6B